ncbi:MAG: type II secretion system protein [Nitrospirae bacterium]|nr:type II secretion system protein [Nitrospirota bacterium]
MRTKGFTFVETMVVMAIIAVLTALVAPTMMGIRAKARSVSLLASSNTVETEVRTILSAFENKEPIVFTSKKGDICLEHPEGSTRCNDAYPDIATIRKYTTLQTIIDHMVTQYQDTGNKDIQNGGTLAIPQSCGSSGGVSVCTVGNTAVISVNMDNGDLRNPMRFIFIRPLSNPQGSSAIQSNNN